MSDAQDPGDWLREQMERRHLSTHQVAEAVGLRDQAVYYWITGRTAPKDEAAAKLAAVLDVPEMEVRRRFKLWVPSETDGQQPAMSRGELEQIKKELLDILGRLDKLQGE